MSVLSEQSSVEDIKKSAESIIENITALRFAVDRIEELESKLSAANARIAELEASAA